MQDAFVNFDAHLEIIIDKAINSIIAYKKLHIELPSKELDELKSKLEESENNFKDLKEKYKQRFLSPAEVKKEDAKEIKDSFDEPEEKKFIDVKIEDL